LTQGNTINDLSSFLKLEGKDSSGKQTLLQIYSNPKTPPSDKLLLEEFLANGNEKDEALDQEVKNNPYALT
jgi:ABC-type lipoprotein export system ATPase subunit